MAPLQQRNAWHAMIHIVMFGAWVRGWRVAQHKNTCNASWTSMLMSKVHCRPPEGALLKNDVMGRALLRRSAAAAAASALPMLLWLLLPLRAFLAPPAWCSAGKSSCRCASCKGGQVRRARVVSLSQASLLPCSTNNCTSSYRPISSPRPHHGPCLPALSHRRRSCRSGRRSPPRPCHPARC